MQAFWRHNHSYCYLLFILKLLFFFLFLMNFWSEFFRTSYNALRKILLVLFLYLVIHKTTLVIDFNLGNVVLKSNENFFVVFWTNFKINESMDHMWIWRVCNINFKVNSILILLQRFLNCYLFLFFIFVVWGRPGIWVLLFRNWTWHPVLFSNWYDII